MATGDQADITSRIYGTLPRWFGGTYPILNAVIQGLAYAGAFAYSLYAYAKLQTRIKTATDGWLDMMAADFFGTAIQRTANQSDASFRSRIIANLFRERGTRAAINRVLVDLTGRTPAIFEPLQPNDAGAYGISTSGYGVAGGYGSMSLPFQAFVTAYRPSGAGIPTIAGYGIPTGAYSTASRAEYASITSIIGQVTDADIYAAVDSVKPCGSIAWTRILT